MNKIKRFLIAWLLKENGAVYVVKGQPIWFLDANAIDVTSELPGIIIPVYRPANGRVADVIACYSIE